MTSPPRGTDVATTPHPAIQAKVAATRASQGLPPTVEDPAALERAAAVLRLISCADAHALTEEPRWSGANLILRMPPTVVGIDIDAYPPKTGAATSPKPNTGGSARRAVVLRADDGVSGIRLLRVPDGTVLQTVIGFPELSIGHIDVIQRHHRYAVVWPSIHPTGALYTWRGADGEVLDQPPSPDDLPLLPEAWLQALAGTGTAAERACPEQVTRSWLVYQPVTPAPPSSTGSRKQPPRYGRPSNADTTTPPRTSSGSCASANKATPGYPLRWPSCGKCSSGR